MNSIRDGYRQLFKQNTARNGKYRLIMNSDFNMTHSDFKRRLSEHESLVMEIDNRYTDLILVDEIAERCSEKYSGFFELMDVFPLSPWRSGMMEILDVLD